MDYNVDYYLSYEINSEMFVSSALQRMLIDPRLKYCVHSLNLITAGKGVFSSFIIPTHAPFHTGNPYFEDNTLH